MAYQALRDLTCPLSEPLALHSSPQPRALFGDLQTSPVLVLSCAWKALPSHTNHFPLVNSYPSTFCWGRLLQGVFALPDLNIQSLSHPPIPVYLSSVGYLCVCPSVHLPHCSLTSLRIRTSHLCAPAPLTLPDRSRCAMYEVRSGWTISIPYIYTAL